MKQICKPTMLLLLAALLAGCSEETVRPNGGEEPHPGGEGSPRREVLLTLNNELVLKSAATRADDTPIATAEENAISSLDVYVFGSPTEGGNYTFQERFAYRAAEGADLPMGATRLDLTATDDSKKQTKGLLKLKKGLFVKLYCVANCPELIDPKTTNPVSEIAFVPLAFNEPGQADSGLASEGSPTENEFTTYHTPLLETGIAGDVLLTPLAMSGSYTIPLDLTDLESFTRLQIGFKLTRLAARFDITNNADESRFTIKEIAMGNGRRGSQLFPIRVYGETPAANPGELITYPVRAFDGENANTAATQTGAFYSYPSPSGDQGFLILKGIYQANKTESKEVSYQLPFTQYADDGTSTTLEINNNHRYTVGITKADDYHLDFTLTVADWTDSGNVNDYTPGGDGTADISLDIPDTYKDLTFYTGATRTISMYIKDKDSNFDLIVRSGTPLSLQSTYAGGLEAQQYDWLTIDNIPTRAALSEYKYKLSVNKDYDGLRYPKAVLRFMNLTDGTETVVYVDAQAAPSLNPTTQPVGSYNTFDPVKEEASLYKTTGSNVKIQLTCADGITLKSKPDWLDESHEAIGDAETAYTFTLNDRETTDTEGTITFCNANIEEWTVSVKVILLDASITPTFSDMSGGNTFADDTKTVTMKIVDGSSFKVATTSAKGISTKIEYQEGSSLWLTQIQSKAVSNETSFSLNNSALSAGMAKPATITMKNTVGGDDYVFTVTPEFQAPVLTSAASATLSATKSTSQVPATRITGNCLGGCTIEGADWITYDKKSENDKTYNYLLSIIPGVGTYPTSLPAPQTITIKNRQDPTKQTTVTLNFTEVNAWIASSPSGYAEYISSNQFRMTTSGGTMTVSLYTMFAEPALTPRYDGSYCPSKNWGDSWFTITRTKSEVVSNRMKYTYSIRVSSSSGTDAAYQLHKGYVTIKHSTNSQQITEYTVWRGASYYGYYVGSGSESGSPYYTAIKKGSYWWAPVNVGATRIPTSASDTYGRGHFYQWGRPDYSDPGCTIRYYTSSSTAPYTYDFYAVNSGNFDWLPSLNNSLWNNDTNDPCPGGYRVPTKTELYTLAGTGTNSNGTLKLTSSVSGQPDLVLPFSGRMMNTNGSLDASTHYWSCTPEGIYVHAIYIGGNTVATTIDWRAFAFPLRCVRK